MADRTKLAVIGGGPKAAALAARVAAVDYWQRGGNPVGAFDPTDLRPAPVLHMFERHDHLAAHWAGHAGYTDGVQELSTQLDRDLVDPAVVG